MAWSSAGMKWSGAFIPWNGDFIPRSGGAAAWSRAPLCAEIARSALN